MQHHYPNRQSTIFAVQSVAATVFLALATVSFAATDITIGKHIATEGHKAHGIEPCANCHQADGGGSEDVGAPRLAAMNAVYLTHQGLEPGIGASVYAEKCAICHGADGEGAWAGAEMVFPSLWGARSYNWGAGMHKINTAAAYIKANMPLGNYIRLTDQEAWDVAAFINSHERPQDPRFDGNLESTMKQFHSSKYDYYGKRKCRDGKLLGQASPESGK